jgi:hypothetical protein
VPPCLLLLLFLLLLLQMMDESGPEHLAKAMGPQQTARLLIDTLDLGAWWWQHIPYVHFRSTASMLQRVYCSSAAAAHVCEVLCVRCCHRISDSNQICTVSLLSVVRLS